MLRKSWVLGLVFGAPAGAVPACFDPFVRALIGVKTAVTQSKAVRVVTKPIAPKPKTFAQRREQYKNLPAKFLIRREEQKALITARNKYNALLYQSVRGVSPNRLDAQVREALGYFGEIDPVYDIEGFQEWLKDNHQPNPKFVTLSEWLQDAHLQYEHSTKAVERRFNPSSWFRCVLTNPTARKNLWRDIRFSQSVQIFMYHGKILPTLHEICVHHTEGDKREKNCAYVDPEVWARNTYDFCHLVLGEKVCRALKPREVEGKYLEHVKGQYLQVAQTTGLQASQAAAQAAAHAAAVDAMRYPFDSAINSLIFALISADVNCRNLLMPDHVLGEPIRTGPLTGAERLAELNEKLKRARKVALLSSASYIALSEIEDRLLGKKVNPVQDYILKMPELMLYAVWTTFKGTALTEPIKLQAIPAVITALDDRLSQWGVTELRARIAEAAVKTSDFALSYGFRTLSSMWGQIEFQEIFRGALMPKIENAVKDAYRSFERSGQPQQTHYVSGLEITLARRPNGTLDLELVPHKAFLDAIDDELIKMQIEANGTQSKSLSPAQSPSQSRMPTQTRPQ